MDDNALTNAASDKSPLQLDDLEQAELPPWLKATQKDETASVRSKTTMKDKFVINEDDDETAGWDKVTKLQNLLSKLGVALDSAEYATKSSKYKMDGALRSDFHAVKGEVSKAGNTLRAILVQKSAPTKKIQAELTAGCALYRDASMLLKKVQALTQVD